MLLFAFAPTPAPAATTCTVPYRDAVALSVPPPHYPDEARALGLGPVSVIVNVTIDSAGKPQEAKIAYSSGNMAMDQEARAVAMHSTFAPKIVDCKPVDAMYRLKITMVP